MAFAAAVLLGAGTDSASDASSAEPSRLVALAAAKFPNLTRAERAMLAFADKDTINRGAFAIAGTSAAPLDPSNDPAHASEWSHDRDIRAGLIRWLAVDDRAAAQIDPDNFRVLGAHIVGPLDLSNLHVPFGLEFVRCLFIEPITLTSAEIPYLSLAGSHTGRIRATNLWVHGDMHLGNEAPERDYGGFEASAPVLLNYLKVDGWLDFNGAHLHSGKTERGVESTFNAALIMAGADIREDVNFCCGFESDGAVMFPESRVGADINCNGARFINPGNVALTVWGTTATTLTMSPHPWFPSPVAVEADGIVELVNARLEAFWALNTKFRGRPTEPHGLRATGLSIRTGFVWQGVDLENGAFVDLSDASIGVMIDEERSWPAPGKLLIDGLTYTGFGASPPAFAGGLPPTPSDARSRLRWIGLQPEYHPQPYRQLAKVLRENGDDSGAIEVMVAQQDARFRDSAWPWRVWAALLKYTIGYGHRPLLAIGWSLAVVLLGWLVVSIANRAGLMRRTYPENPPAAEHQEYERLYPLLYSLDVFVPFVNLHQEHYWWPNAATGGECRVLGYSMRLPGSLILYYLWLQIIAGWLLSAIFVAGVTGLIRGD
jgi:hypothetical protein